MPAAVVSAAVVALARPRSTVVVKLFLTVSCAGERRLRHHDSDDDGVPSCLHREN